MPNSCSSLHDQLGALHRDLGDACLVQLEHDAALQFGGGIIEMHDGDLRALQRLRRCGGSAPRGDWVSTWMVTPSGIFLFSMRKRHEIEIRLRGGGKAHLDFLEAHVQQGIEHAHLALVAHGLDQRLVAVAQVHRAPDGGLVMVRLGHCRSGRLTGG